MRVHSAETPGLALSSTAFFTTPSRRTLLGATRGISLAETAWLTAIGGNMKTLWILLIVSISGCGAVPQSPRNTNIKLEHHGIYVDQFGNIEKPPTSVAETDAAQKDLQGQAGVDALYVNKIIKDFLEKRKQQRGLKFTLFVHGGLNSSKDFWDRTNQFAETMIKEDQYPVFVGWNSAALTNYFDHLFLIRRGERRPVLGVISAPFILLEDITRSIAHLPNAWYMSVMDPISALKDVRISQEKDYDERMVELEKKTAFRVHSEGPTDGTGIGGSYWTIINPLKLVTAPFVNGLGTGSWESMLRRTDLVLSKPLAFEGELKKRDDQATPVTSELDANQIRTTDADTAVTRLLLEIDNLSKYPPTGQDPVRINLIGHSMGAIVVNNILAKHPRLNVDNVVFMGAAARIKDLETGVVPWMRRDGNDARFYNLSLDPYLEMAEHTARDVLPRGSLLHWIDNIFGEVNSFKDRTAGGWWNIIRTAQDVFPEDLRPCVHLTRFPIGKEFGPQTHTEFDEYYFWRKSFWIPFGRKQPRFDNTEGKSPILYVDDKGNPSDASFDSDHPCRAPGGATAAQQQP
jgi:hypothetical protein